VLYGLALALRGAFGDGSTDKDDELLDAVALEIAEVANVGSVRENHGIGTFTCAFKHQQRCDLHRFLSLALDFLSPCNKL